MKIRSLAVAISLLLAQGAGAASLSFIAAAAVGPDQLTDAVVADSARLLLRGGAIDPLRERLDYRASGAAADVDAARYAVVQFVQRSKSARASLERVGLRVVGYVPNNAYVVALDKDHNLDTLGNLPGVRWSGYYQPGMKLDPSLWPTGRADLRTAPRGGYEVDVFGFPGESAPRLAQALTKVFGVSLVHVASRPDVPQVRVRVEAAQLDALTLKASAEEGVSWIVPHAPESVHNSGGPPTIQGNQTTGICSGGATALCGPTPLWNHGIIGSNQIVSISDSGLDANEAWFTTLDNGAGPHTEVTLADPTPAVAPALGISYPNNKVIGYWVQPGADAYDNNGTCTPDGDPNSFHGTHTSGTLVGDAAGTFLATTYVAATPTTPGHEGADGMAPNAQLLFQDIGDADGCLSITDIPAMLAQAYGGGARIHSASWGNDDKGVYSGDDLLVDTALWNQENMIFVVAAGNSGSGTKTIGSPANSKSAISVGALNHAPLLSVVSFSSRGPTADGRIKPDITAQGTSIISAAGDTSTNGTPEAPVSKSLDGTSMATPTVAGNAVLARQYFVDGFYPRGAKTAADTYNPSGMAMKAVLLNGTNPSGSGFGGFNTGWGRAWLGGNLWFADEVTPDANGNGARRLRLFERTNASGLLTGDVHEYTIASVSTGVELRATLAWYDPEAQPGSALTLVNNLDLEVVAPNGSTIYKGNVLTSGASVAGGAADLKNSVEQVRLTAPTAGSYTFRVKGTNIPGGSRSNTDRQGYALAVSGKFGLPDPTPLAAPAIGGAITTGGAVQVTWGSVAGAQNYQIYRVPGTCAASAPGDFRQIGSANATSFNDTTAQGGFAYAYRVRAIGGDVEGAASGCVDLTAATACTLQPTHFPASLAVTGSSGAACHIGTAWQAGSTNCPGIDTTMTYTVRRSDDPYFATSTTVASALSTPAYNDLGVVQDHPYFYRVNAVDSAGNVSPDSVTAGATPIGPNGLDGKGYRDDVDAHAYMKMATPWQITNTQKSNGSFSYHNAGDGVTYPSNSCYSLTTPVLHVPANALLNFKARYNLEYQWDGMVLEVSSDGGANWTDLPPTGGYPTTLAATGSPPANACGFPASKGAFSGVSTTASNANPANSTAVAVFKPFSTSLAAYAGQAIQLRWRITSDPGAEFEGAYIDEVAIANSNTDVLFQSDFEGLAVEGCSPAP